MPMAATQTQTLRRPPVQVARVHDYLYDPLHTVSSDRDHARATFKAHTGASRIKKIPIYKTMFSELRHMPRQQIRLDATDPVPKTVNRQWPGYANQAREAVIRYKTFNYDPSIKMPVKHHPSVDVSGTNRYIYFRRPILPFQQAVPPMVVLASARNDPLAAAAAAEQQAALDRAPTPLTRTMMTQTDYRDSEAQTDPYTPGFVVRPGSEPEVLTLATLSYGQGLPAGMAEVDMIERQRAKRAWEETLPSLGDISQLEKRKRMMDEMERKEWAMREAEIEKLQEARLDVLKKLLQQRELKHQELNTKRLDRLWAKKQREKDEKLKKIRNEHIKTIRKLTEKRRTVEGNLERRDVTEEYADYGSQTYAPMTRIGVFLDRGSEQFVVKSHYINTYHGLCELENSLPDFVLNPRIQAPKPKTVTKTGFVKRKYRPQMELAEMAQNLKEEKIRRDEPPKPMRFLQKIEKPIPRPATPVVEGPSLEEEERELAVIFLQKVLRGRSLQNMMFEGKEKRIELIAELRSTHALQEAEQFLKKQDKQATLALQRRQRLQQHKENYIDEALGQMEGESLGDMLDFLQKELIRLQEERRIHAFSMLAERQRRIREAEESGRRQVEERRRREQDEIFKQVIKVHQDTVDNYLQEIIITSMDNTAHKQAVEEIEHLTKKINDVAYEIEEKRDALQSEEIVSDLVHGFLLPEAQKATIRERVEKNQRKHLVAAHAEIFKEGDTLIQSHAKPLEDGSKVFGEALETASGHQTPKGSRPASVSGDAEKPTTGSRPPSLNGSRPPSAAGSKQPSMPGSRPNSVSGSQKGEDQSKPATPLGSKQITPRGSKPVTPSGSKPATPVASRPTSKAGSRPSSAKIQQSAEAVSPTPSATGSQNEGKQSRPPSAKVPSLNGSRAPSAVASPTGSKPQSPAGSRPVSASGSQTRPRTPSAKGLHRKSSVPSVSGSKPGTPQASKPGTPQGSKLGTPQGSKPGTPQTSKPGTPQGSKPGTPQTSKPGTPKTSKPGTPQASKPGTPQASKPGTPQASKPGTPQTSKPGTPKTSKPGTPQTSKPGTPQTSKPGTPQASKPASIAGSRPSSAASQQKEINGL